MNRGILKVVAFIALYFGCAAGQLNKSISEISLGESKGQPGEPFTYHDTSIVSGYDFQTDFLEWIPDEMDFSLFERIERNGDSLVFRTNGPILVFVNEAFDEEKGNFDAPLYRFVSYYDKANVAELEVEVYEYAYHVLIDMTTGDTIRSIGRPLFTDDQTLMFVSNVDMEAGFTENGFQLIRKNENGFEMMRTFLLDDWGIAAASWIGNGRLLVSKVVMDENYEMFFVPGILTLNLEDM